MTFRLVLLLSLLASVAHGQQPKDEIKAARELFQEAFKDEQEKRYPEALEKFQRVAKVKESASVRYRIATVLMAMGRLREARDLFRALAASKPSLPPNDQDIADSAAEKAAELDRRIPKLVLRADAESSDVHVTIDGAPVPVSTTARPIELDPGDHIIASSVGSATPTQQTVNLRDGGGEVPHTVVTGVAPAADKPRPNEDPSTGGGSSSPNLLPWVAIGGGAVLLIGGVAFLVSREGAIDDVKAVCPNNVCPTITQSQVEEDRDRAKLFGPLGAAFGILGAAAIGVGVYLLVRHPNSSAKAPAFLTATGFRVRF